MSPPHPDNLVCKVIIVKWCVCSSPTMSTAIEVSHLNRQNLCALAECESTATPTRFIITNTMKIISSSSYDAFHRRKQTMQSPSARRIAKKNNSSPYTTTACMNGGGTAFASQLDSPMLALLVVLTRKNIHEGRDIGLSAVVLHTRSRLNDVFGQCTVTVEIFMNYYSRSCWFDRRQVAVHNKHKTTEATSRTKYCCTMSPKGL